MADPHLPPPDRDLLAAELALGFLGEAERVEAEQLQLQDPAFAANVDTWRREGARLLAELPADHPAHTWRRIEASIAPSAGVSSAWKPLALAASLAAIIFASLWTFTPSERVTVSVEEPFRPASYAVAQIKGSDAQSLLSAVHDRENGTIYLHLSDVTDPERVPELWLVGSDGSPHSLGYGQPNSVATLELTAEQRAIIDHGGVLAISLEEPAEQPHEVPSDVLGTSEITPLGPTF